MKTKVDSARKEILTLNSNDHVVRWAFRPSTDESTMFDYILAKKFLIEL